MGRASFCTTHCLKNLEENYSTWCALTGAEPATESIKDLVMAALDALGLTEVRAIKIDLDTFFKLLLEFNKRGIHFSNMNVGAKVGDKSCAPDENFFVDDDDDGMDE